MIPTLRATRAIIHLDNLRHNIRLLRSHIGPVPRICMAVKADAYGHGAVPITRTALAEGVDAFGVATVGEGRELREAGIRAPVLLFSPVLPEENAEIVLSGLAPMVGSREAIASLAAEAAKQDKPVEVHLKVDTGMGRIGCQPEDAPDLAELIASDDWLKLAGVCTHFPVADAADSDFTTRQLERFQACVDGIRNRGIDPAALHAANSGAILAYPPSYFQMVRPGIMLYGYYPSQEQPRDLPLKPVMELVSKVSFLKKVPKGTGISYGLTHRVERDTVIATIPAGYADGYSRLLSNRGQVCIRGKRYPVVGRVCMDQTMVNVGPDSEVELYEDVILFGPDPPAPDAEEIAGLMQTIPYEVTCLINRRVPRVYLG